MFNANGTQIMTPSGIADPGVPKIPPSQRDGGLNFPHDKPANVTKGDTLK